MKRIIFLALILTSMTGCATGWYKQTSSGQIGCPEDMIEITDASQGMTSKSWVATCKGRRFICSSNATGGLGGHTASCKEAI